MDIKINAIDGLPPESYLGIRVGQAMKQAKYDPEKIFRFPEARRLGKIDIFRRVASADLAWDVGEAETRMCNAVGANGIASKLQVSFSRSTREHRSASPKQEFARPSNDSNKKYMQLHDVEGMLAGAMRALLKEKPADAPAFLIWYITSRYKAAGDLVFACSTDAQLPSPVMKVEKASTPENAPPQILKMPPPAPKVTAAAPPREGFVDAPSTGKAEPAWEASSLQSIQFRQYYRAHLLASNLHACYHSLHGKDWLPPELAKNQLAEPQPRQLKLGKQIAAKPLEDFCCDVRRVGDGFGAATIATPLSFRQYYRTNFVGFGYEDYFRHFHAGVRPPAAPMIKPSAVSLAQHVEPAPQFRQYYCLHVLSSKVEPCFQSLHARAWSCGTSAQELDPYSTVVAEEATASQSPERVFRQVCKDMHDASIDCRLERAVIEATVARQADQASFLSDVYHLLSEAVHNGRLEKLVASIKDHDSDIQSQPSPSIEIAMPSGAAFEDIRLWVFKQLNDANRDGRLKQAITESMGAGERGKDALLRNVFELLRNAAEDGRLETAVASLDGRAGLSWGLETGEAPSQAQELDFDSLRAEAHQALYDATADGSLETALSSVTGSVAAAALAPPVALPRDHAHGKRVNPLRPQSKQEKCTAAAKTRTESLLGARLSTRQYYRAHVLGNTLGRYFDFFHAAAWASSDREPAVEPACSIREMARDTLVRASRDNSIERLLATRLGSSEAQPAVLAGLPRRCCASRIPKRSSREFYKVHVLPSACDDAFARLHSLFRG